MAGVTRIVSRYTAFDAVHNSEEFSSASRSLKMGFITSVSKLSYFRAACVMVPVSKIESVGPAKGYRIGSRLGLHAASIGSSHLRFWHRRTMVVSLKG